MTNALLIIFGFFELVMRVLLVILLVCTILGIVLLDEYPVSSLVAPTLWDKIQ